MTLSVTQALVVGTILVTAGLGKLSTAAGRSMGSRSALGMLISGETLVRLAWLLLGAIEVAAGSFIVALPASPWPVAFAVPLLLSGAAFAVWALRIAPERPCGCLGSASDAPVSWKTSARATLLAGIALSATVFPLTLNALIVVAIAGAEVLAIALLSPELARVTAVTDRLLRRFRGDCATSQIPLEASIRVIHASAAWSKLRSALLSEEWEEHWREGCWRFLTFPATYQEKRATAVFAARVPPGRQDTRGVLVDDETNIILVSGT